MPATVQRIARLNDGSRVFWGFLDGERVQPASGDPFTRLEPAGPPRPVEGLAWLPPCAPSKIIGVGRNYRAHAAELGNEVPSEPLLFFKPPSALLAHGGTILLPAASARVDHEGEIGVVVGRRLKDASEAEAIAGILGYTCVNDVTARDLQKKDVQFTRAKGFDTFCPVGPCVAIGLQPADLAVETWVNGTRRQSAPAAEMLFGIGALLSYISGVMTLEPGDLIATGTPEGVAPLRPGDEVTVAVAGVGRLINRVEAAPG